MSKGNGTEPDLVAEGFHRLDPKFIDKRPPKIAWGRLYQEKNDADKIKYLEQLSCAMNHAAYLVQEERNELLELCDKKEGQIEQLSEAMRQNNAMIQSEVTKMNEQRQGFNQEVARLNARIRELECGDIDRLSH